MGASLVKIINLLSEEFFLLILLNNVIRLLPIFLGAKQWLAGYEYQTSISISFFKIPDFIVFAVAAIIISGQSVKTA